jgi:site-specific DNA recombinase
MKRRPPAKRDTSNLTDLRVGLYVRVSLDQDDTGKSTDDQEAVGREWVGKVGAVLVDVYSDRDRSASRYATKEREEFTRLLGDIAAGKLDAVWFWELSRSQRRLDVFAKLRDLCRDMGVLWVIRDRVVDPNDSTDMMSSAMMAVIGENESEMTSQRVQRGKKSSANLGRRSGRVPYGYRAEYDRDGRYLHDVPDLFDGNAVAVEDSPAAIVREIYARILAGHSLTSIRRDLNDRGIRTKQGYPWENSKIRHIAMSPTYLGQRVYQVGEGILQADRVKMVLDGVETKWPPLVDAETFWAVHRILSDPARRTTRPGRRTHALLSSLARCAKCGGKLILKSASTARKPPRAMYFCTDKSCVGIYAELLDDYAEKVMVRWLSDPDVVADLTRVDDSVAATQARGDVEQLRAELAGLYRDAKAGRVSPVIATASEKGLQERIDEAEHRIQAATLPPMLRGNIGPQAKAGWEALDIEAKRAIIRVVADIRVQQIGRGRGSGEARRPGPCPAQDRVEWRWLLGPRAQPAATTDSSS